MAVNRQEVSDYVKTKSAEGQLFCLLLNLPLMLHVLH